MNTLLAPYKWILWIGLAGALVAGYFAWERHIRADERAKVVTEYNSKIDAQKAEAQAKLADVTAKVEADNKRLRDAKDLQENEDVINAKTIEILADHGRALIAKSGGVLVDPNAKGCGGSSGSPPTPATANPGDSAANAAQGTGLLSTPLTELLLSTSQDAALINLAYISCRQTLINERLPN